MSYFPPTGSVVGFQSDPTKLLTHASVSGNVSATINNSSVAVMSVVPHSVATLQGTNPWTISNPSVQVVGLMPTQSVSGVGLFNVNQVGNGSVFTGFRNDALASTVGVNLTARMMATDSAGRAVVTLAPTQARVQGVSSTVNTTSASLIAAGGAGLKTYLTNVMVANTGSVATVVNFLDGDNSVIGRTIAPGGGGSNINFPTPMATNGFNQQIHYTANTAVSVLHVSGYGHKAP